MGILDEFDAEARDRRLYAAVAAEDDEEACRLARIAADARALRLDQRHEPIDWAARAARARPDSLWLGI